VASGKTRGTGRQRYLTDEDRVWIRKRLSERKLGVTDFARQLGMTRQGVYLILRGKTERCEDWPRLVATLGGTPPSGEPIQLDENLRKIVKHWPELSDATREMLAQLIVRLRDK